MRTPATARPTMNDVALHARVSLKTVSRVVNRESGVSASLTAQVSAAIAALGYRPDLRAATLRRADPRTGTIGLLLADVANPFSAALHRAVEDVARDRGAHVLIGSVDECPDREGELARAFTMRRVDGLIVAPSGFDLAGAVGPDTPVVFVDRIAPGLRADAVLATNAAGAGAAVRHLAGSGHRRIAFIGDFDRVMTGRQRLEGALAAQRAAGLEPDPALIVSGAGTATAAAAAVTGLFRRDTPPTALFTGQGSVTVGAVRALRDLGLHRRVALVGFDDFPLADLLEPAVTVVAQDPVRMGRTAAETLFRRIAGDEGAAASYSIPTRLICRGSGELRPV